MFADQGQIIEYFPGIGTNEKSLRKWNSGVTGDGYAEQIAEVYKVCQFRVDGVNTYKYVSTAVAIS